MRYLPIFAGLALASCGSGPELPAHTTKIDLLDPGNQRVEISVTENISETECEALLDEYRHEAGDAGQVSVRKPSRKLGGMVAPWCVDNLDGKGVVFNTDLF